MKIEFRKVKTLAEFGHLPEGTIFSMYDDIEYKKTRVQTIEGDESGYVGYNPYCHRMIVSVDENYKVDAVLPVPANETKVGECFYLEDDESTIFVRDEYDFTRLAGKGKLTERTQKVYRLETDEN